MIPLSTGDNHWSKVLQVNKENKHFRYKRHHRMCQGVGVGSDASTSTSCTSSSGCGIGNRLGRGIIDGNRFLSNLSMRVRVWLQSKRKYEVSPVDENNANCHSPQSLHRSSQCQEREQDQDRNKYTSSSSRDAAEAMLLPFCEPEGSRESRLHTQNGRRRSSTHAYGGSNAITLKDDFIIISQVNHHPELKRKEATNIGMSHTSLGLANFLRRKLSNQNNSLTPSKTGPSSSASPSSSYSSSSAASSSLLKPMYYSSSSSSSSHHQASSYSHNQSSSTATSSSGYSSSRITSTNLSSSLPTSGLTTKEISGMGSGLSMTIKHPVVDINIEFAEHHEHDKYRGRASTETNPLKLPLSHNSKAPPAQVITPATRALSRSQQLRQSRNKYMKLLQKAGQLSPGR